MLGCEFLRVGVDARSTLRLGQLSEHVFHSHLFELHFLPPCVIKESVYSLIYLHLRVLGQGLRSHEPLEHRVREIVHSRYSALIHHLKGNVTAIFRPKLTLVVYWVLKEVTLTRSRVLFIVQGSQVLLFLVHTSCSFAQIS